MVSVSCSRPTSREAAAGRDVNPRDCCGDGTASEPANSPFGTDRGAATTSVHGALFRKHSMRRITSEVGQERPFFRLHRRDETAIAGRKPKTYVETSIYNFPAIFLRICLRVAWGIRR